MLADFRRGQEEFLVLSWRRRREIKYQKSKCKNAEARCAGRILLAFWGRLDMHPICMASPDMPPQEAMLTPAFS